ncbi:DUF6283 family protein [Streptosporangium sp. NPDC050855]|uniref:DUF6283 family protein n=1 Tax=Streptosporangium sp. NPDC050855 TaxID=3366194 RepID=UPI00378DAB5D
MKYRRPAPRPCESCPYRKDVPSGVWAPEEYEKLREYDRPTGEQPPTVFLCHQQDRDSASRICGGWAGCHDGDELLALRVATMTGRMTPEEAYAVTDYVSPVPLFSSGKEAADHGMAEVEQPSDQAGSVIEKIARVRRDIRWRDI